MIGRLSGILLEKQPPHLLLDVNGIAYEVQASMHTFYRLPEVGSVTVLHTHFLVREDAQQLFGFADKQERALFRSLLKVNGIGAKSAIALLSSIEPDAFVRCISDQDTATLQRLPGIGKKTAERLIIEMRDRLVDWEGNANLAIDISTPSASSTLKSAEQDAISALIALGYKPQEATKAVLKVTAEGLSSEELIRLSLKGIAS